MKKHIIFISFALLLMSGCSTTTIKPMNKIKITSPPSYTMSKAFYFYGLKNEHRINVKTLCGQKKVSQMQTQHSFTDGLLASITLGIYMPQTVKIWCE